MKKIILALALCMALNCTAKVVKEGNTFKEEQQVEYCDSTTEYKYVDKQGKEYPVFKSKRGSLYIWKISKKSGKGYRKYLPKEVQPNKQENK